MPIFDLDDFMCGSGDIVPNSWSRGGCPDYSGDGLVTGPIPNANGEINTGSTCYNDTYVYKKVVNSGTDCEDCEDVEVTFILTPQLTDRICAYVCRKESGYTLEAPNGFSLVGDNVRFDPSASDGFLVRDCDGADWNFGTDGDLEWNIGQTTWMDYSPGSFITLFDPGGCAQTPENETLLFRNDLSSDSCGSSGRCTSDIQSVRVIFSDYLNLGSCPGESPEICETDFSVDFTTVDFYTPASTCDSVTNPQSRTTVTLEAKLPAQGSWTTIASGTGTNAPLKSANVVTPFFGGGVTGCETVQYRYRVSTDITSDLACPSEDLDCEEVSAICTLQVCEVAEEITGGSYETCSKA